MFCLRRISSRCISLMLFVLWKFGCHAEELSGAKISLSNDHIIRNMNAGGIAIYERENIVVANCCILYGDEGDWEQGLTIHQVTSSQSCDVV